LPEGKSYSVNNGWTGPARTSAGAPYDARAAAAQRREQSKAAYEYAQKARNTYRTPQGKTRPLDPHDQRVERIRRQVDPWHWSMREDRRRQIHVVTRPTVPVPVYDDPYSAWFWYWLLTQDINTRALWAYHHRSDMDLARYRDLLAKDQQLEARVRELDGQGIPRDPAYVPPGLDNDLMYDDGFVEAAVNPQHTAPTHSMPEVYPARTITGALWRILLIVAFMAFLVWLVFIKRWGGT
jgi:hypothetical protein